MKYPELTNQYILEKTVGCGGFGKVKLATHVLTGEKVAIKIMEKEKLKQDLPRVKQEIEALKSLSHPNICQLYQMIESDTHFFLIMEYCCGGELFDHIIATQKLPEGQSRGFFRQIVSAVAYLHENGFAHRDLKPENILLDKDHNLKLIDFGLCVKPKKGMEAQLSTCCGSPNYAAPELIMGEKYVGAEIDMWSLGVILYALLCGTLPFDDDNIEKLYKKILVGDYEEPEWLSHQSRSLIRLLLQVDAKRRLSTARLCTHPWLLQGFNKPVDNTSSKCSLARDEQCLHVLSRHVHTSPLGLWTELQERRYDYTMASYLLLVERSRSGLPVRLLFNIGPTRALSSDSEAGSTPKRGGVAGNETYIVLGERPGRQGRQGRQATPGEGDENSCGRAERRSRRGLKRTRSPGLGDDLQQAKRTNRTPGESPACAAATPSSARKVLEGLEKGLSIARRVLTPHRRSNGAPPPLQPTVISGRDLYNVSSTCSTSPDHVLNTLRESLLSHGIAYTQKGYTLRGKLKQPAARAARKPVCKLSFELEVCWLPEPAQRGGRRSSAPPAPGAVVGIRRKRLKGDVWIYKKICEDILAMAAPAP